MPSTLTTKTQVSGYRLQVRRVEQGFLRRTTQLLASPFSPQTISVGIGLALAVLIPVAGLFVHMMFPKSNQNGASMIITKSGGEYVMFNNVLHPYTNLASARLIVGKPDPPKVVKDDALSRQPRGHLMGIPSGPNNLNARTDDTAQWSVCDKHTDTSELSLTKTDALSTTLFAGVDAVTSAVTALARDDAVVVQPVDKTDEQWLIYHGQRSSVGVQDMATRAALGLTPAVANKAVPMSRGLFNAIPASPALTSPYIPDRGKPSVVLADQTNGDVLVTAAADGSRQYRVVLTDGVQQISELIAQLLLNTGSKEVTAFDHSAAAKAPLSNLIDVRRYPERAPTFRQPHVICWQWRKGEHDLRATTAVLSGESLPVSRDNIDKVVALLKSADLNATANASYTAPGKGWFVRVTGSAEQSHAQEQLMWIDDTGVRYLIGLGEQNKYDSTVKALGIGAREPLPIPWAVASLYGPGSTLSREAALTEHEHLLDDLNQHATSTNERAAGEGS